MIRTLVVGFGFSATTFHLPFLRQLSGFSITGIVSSRPDDVAIELPGVPVYSSLEEALVKACFDLTVITTPNHRHENDCRVAILAGSHVLVEKPFTLSSSSAKQLVELACQHDRQLCVYQNRRFDGDFLTVEKLIASGELGDIRRFVSRFDRFRPHPRERWRENAGPGAGIFWDLGPHLIDQAILLFGRPTKVSATINTLRDGGKSDDFFDVVLHYRNYLVQLGSSPFQAGETLRFDVQGTQGSYRKYGLDPQESQLKAGMAFTNPDWAVTQPDADGCLYSAESQRNVATEMGQYLNFYQQLCDAISRKEELPACAASVIPVIEVIEAARQSAESGHVVCLP